MGIKMKIPWFLQRDTNGMKEVEVNGNTVGDCLRNLVGLFPPIERELFDQQAKLSYWWTERLLRGFSQSG